MHAGYMQLPAVTCAAAAVAFSQKKKKVLGVS
jgi:hypothetical protein